jgi:hypothetical protein
MAEMPAKINILYGQNGSWMNGLPHLLQSFLRIRQVGDNEPCMNKIELLEFVLDDVRESKLQICEVLLLGFLPGQVNFDFISVRRNNPAHWTNHPS